MRKIPELTEIRNNRILTPEIDRDFFEMLEKCLLLSLKEAKILNFMQYRYAEEKMGQQKRIRARNRMDKL